MQKRKISDFKLFKITIKDDLFGKLTGEFYANSQEKAVADAKEFYAHENDTYENAIEILSVDEIREDRSI